MAFSRVDQIYMILALAVMLWHGARAQSGCTNAIIGLSPCLSYVTRNVSTPTPACCLQLNNVVQTAPQCLCTLLNNNGGGALGNININQTQALTLPVACNVQTPPLSQCNVVSNPPASSPDASPAAPTESSQNSPSDGTSTTKSPDAPATTSNPNIPSGTASKTVPASSDGIATKPFHITVLMFFITALASNQVFKL